MGVFSYFRRQKRKEEQEIRKLELEREYLSQKYEQKLELEKRKKEIELETLEKKAQLERIKLDYQIKEQEQSIIDDFSDDDSGFSEESNTEDVLLGTILSKVMTNQNSGSALPGNSLENQSSKNNPTFEQGGAGLELSDEEIKIILSKIDENYLKIARTLPTDTLRKLIKSKYPQISDLSLDRAILILKEKN